MQEKLLVLQVPYPEKDAAKALGARWDPLKKTWYVPPGADPKLFTRWLNKEGYELTIEDNVYNTDIQEYTLRSYLAQFTQVVAQIGHKAQWVCAEISYLPPPKRGHYYLELVEHDLNGAIAARAPAIIWQSNAQTLLVKFKSDTGGELQADIKLLLKITARFDPLYGFKLTIEDIDPAYTLGDMAAKLAAIRKSLKQEQLYSLNQSQQLPTDFTRVAVIAPPDAAGLGDFSREAAILQKHQLCEFEYFHTTFQGKNAPPEIKYTIEQIMGLHKQHSYDVIIIIRGGGAVADLAWLNDLELARTICQASLPILTGVGHKKDRTIIDEVACHSFDTPSKVSAYILSSICRNAESAEQHWLQIHEKIYQRLLNAETHTLQHRKWIFNEIQNKFHYVLQSIDHLANTIEHQCAQNIQQTSLQCDTLKKITLERIHQQTTELALTLSHFNPVQIGHLAQLPMQKVYFELTSLSSKLLQDIKQHIKETDMNIQHWIKSIIGLGPQATLDRGFAMLQTCEGKIITTTLAARKARALNLILKDGTLRITTVEEQGYYENKK